MKIENGGQTNALSSDGKVKEVSFLGYPQLSGSSRQIHMSLNDCISLSYLTIEEAIALRDELNEAIRIYTGI